MGHVATLPADHGRAEPVDVLGVGHLALRRVERLLLEEHHRVVVADRRRHQPDDVGGSGGDDDLQPGHGHQPVLDRLGVLRPEAQPAAVAEADDERERDLAVGHVAGLGDLVDDDVVADREEVGEHQLGDRAEAGHRRAHGRADDRLLGDRRVPDAFGTELVEQARRSP